MQKSVLQKAVGKKKSLSFGFGFVILFWMQCAKNAQKQHNFLFLGQLACITKQQKSEILQISNKNHFDFLLEKNACKNCKRFVLIDELCFLAQRFRKIFVWLFGFHCCARAASLRNKVTVPHFRRRAKTQKVFVQRWRSCPLWRPALPWWRHANYP